MRRRCLRLPPACRLRVPTDCMQPPLRLLPPTAASAALPGMGALCFPAQSSLLQLASMWLPVDVPSVPTRSPFLAGYTDYPTLEETEEGKAFLAAQAN